MGTTSKHLIETQIPYHIRESSPLFTKFLQYYYEFVDQSKITDIIQDVLKYNDVDEADVEFIKSFFEEFRSLPKTIAADERFIAKHIYELYKTKGTEKSIKLLFKIVYGDDVSVRYPQEYILRTSDGRWTQSKFVTLNFESIPSDFTGQPGSLLNYQNDAGRFSQHVTQIDWISATKLRVYFNSLNTTTVYENQELTVVDTNQVTIVGTASKEFSKLNIIDGGSGWKRGQTIIIEGTYKDTIIRVSGIGAIGNITNIEIIEYGWTHNTNQTVVINTPLYNAIFGFTTSVVVLTRGYYESDIGQISNAEVRIQDNKYYQQHSYVIDTNYGIETFKDVIKLVHPAGTRYFSQLIKTADLNMADYIDSYYTQSIGTIYLKDVTDTDDYSYRDITHINTDSVTPTESITNKTVTTPRSDSTTVSEADAKHVTKVSTDSTTLSDSNAKTVTQVSADSTAPTDAITSFNVVADKSDSTEPTDAATSDVTKVLADSTAPTDDTAKTVTSVLSDSTSTSENISAKTATIVQTDSTEPTDTPAKTPTSVLSDSISTPTDGITSFSITASPSDTASTTDDISAKTINFVISDTASISETFSVSGNISTSLDDTVAATDSVVTTTTYNLNLSDSVAATEALSITQTKYYDDTVTITDGTPVSTYVVYQSEDYFAEIYVSPETTLNIT